MMKVSVSKRLFRLLKQILLQECVFPKLCLKFYMLFLQMLNIFILLKKWTKANKKKKTLRAPLMNNRGIQQMKVSKREDNIKQTHISLHVYAISGEGINYTLVFPKNMIPRTNSNLLDKFWISEIMLSHRCRRHNLHARSEQLAENQSQLQHF